MIEVQAFQDEVADQHAEQADGRSKHEVDCFHRRRVRV
jgi:hypothetical protein